MTRSEAEEIFISIVMGDKTAVVQMTLKEAQVFRVLVGRTLKEMEKKNRTLWLKARDFGIEYVEPYAIVRKLDANRYKMFSVCENGELVPFIKAGDAEAPANIVIDDIPNEIA